MDIELKELSNIYLQTFQEEDGASGGGQNPQQSVEVGSHAKAIRYQARRDNVPLPKAFNDYVAKNQLSGAERTALRQKLGFMESTEMDEEEHKIGGGNLKKLASKANKRIDADVDGEVDTDDMKSGETGEFVPSSDGKKKVKSKVRFEHVSWREELRELVDVTSSKPKTDEKSREKISEKKVKNKIVINPPQGMTEAIEQLGGQILEMVEIEEAVYGGTSKKEEPKDTRMTVTNADKKGNTPAYQKMKAGDKRYKSADHMGEEVKEVDEAAGSTSTNDAAVKRQLATKEQMMRKQQMLSRQRLQMQKQGKLPSGHMEGLSIDDQMRISREANAKRKPYEPGDRQKQRAAQIKQMAKNSSKDTRTDAQKMTDATGPRPGSRYRGD